MHIIGANEMFIGKSNIEARGMEMRGIGCYGKWIANTSNRHSMALDICSALTAVHMVQICIVLWQQLCHLRMCVYSIMFMVVLIIFWTMSTIYYQWEEKHSMFTEHWCETWHHLHVWVYCSHTPWREPLMWTFLQPLTLKSSRLDVGVICIQQLSERDKVVFSFFKMMAEMGFWRPTIYHWYMHWQMCLFPNRLSGAFRGVCLTFLIDLDTERQGA